MKLTLFLALLSNICITSLKSMEQSSPTKSIELKTFKSATQPKNADPIRFAETFVPTIILTKSAEAQLIASQSNHCNSLVNSDDEDGPTSDSDSIGPIESNIVEKEDSSDSEFASCGGFEQVFSFDDLDDCDPGTPPFLIDRSDIGLPQAPGNKV